MAGRKQKRAAQRAMGAAAKRAKGYLQAEAPANLGVDVSKFKMPKEQQERFDTMAMEAQEREAPQVGQTQVQRTSQPSGIDQSEKEFRQQQQQLYNTLQSKISQGSNAPSLEMMQAFNRAAKQNRAAAGSVSARNRDAALLQAADTTASLQGEAATQRGLLEEQQRQNQIQNLMNTSNILQGARAQDVSIAGLQAQQDIEGARIASQENIQQAQLRQQANLANLQSAIQQGASNDQLMLNLMNQGFTRDQAVAQINIASEQLKAQNYATSMGAASGLATQKSTMQQLAPAIVGGVATLGGAALMASDRKLKKNIKRNEKPAKEFLNALKNYDFHYKSQRFGDKHYGVIAQDLEKTRAGRQMVSNTPAGKVIHANPGPILAALASIHRRQEELERKMEK